MKDYKIVPTKSLNICDITSAFHGIFIIILTLVTIYITIANIDMYNVTQ